MTAQHSAKTGEWFTNPEWVPAITQALGGQIDLDPASSHEANKIIQARGFYTEKDDALNVDWHAYCNTYFCNPPGTCDRDPGTGRYKNCDNKDRCSCKLPHKFLQKCIDVTDGTNMHGIYLAYSVNQLRPMGSMRIHQRAVITLALPKDRIPYIDPATMKPKPGTPCDSAFISISSFEADAQRFADAFRPKGCRIYRMER